MLRFGTKGCHIVQAWLGSLDAMFSIQKRSSSIVDAFNP